eukprot:gnl/Hemi2/13168_TR4504_c0_g1_i1.p1 gnl/Hemi2/13168_TR4504_c0_g1~~gnl/Hemi2/13168_TR4504_c0_g1_i1.p1  ORF type:complete len:233 (-),score=47.64 gnl/Hemi2/13168_TR4504_c0_g1_i1:813-1511(-)
MGTLPRPKIIHAIRHGESTFNAWRFQSFFTFSCCCDPLHYDAPLSKKGQRQVAALREKIKLLMARHDRPQLVVTSPLTRAVQTTVGGFEDTKLPIIVSAAHREILHTACDVGRTPTFLAQDFPNIDFSHLPEIWWYEDAKDRPTILRESRESARLRVKSFKDWLLARPETSIAVVGHSQFFKKFLDQTFKLDNCEIFSFVLSDVGAVSEAKPKSTSQVVPSFSDQLTIQPNS